MENETEKLRVTVCTADSALALLMRTVDAGDVEPSEVYASLAAVRALLAQVKP